WLLVKPSEQSWGHTLTFLQWRAVTAAQLRLVPQLSLLSSPVTRAHLVTDSDNHAALRARGPHLCQAALQENIAALRGLRRERCSFSKCRVEATHGVV
ncbi:hypothetical protein GOODEAATRI_026998, partial [Goodea atripinnis]